MRTFAGEAPKAQVTPCAMAGPGLMTSWQAATAEVLPTPSWHAEKVDRLLLTQREAKVSGVGGLPGWGH